MHLAAGKRALLVQDPNGAVTSLETASEKFGKIYGETGKECGEPYFYYGKALLELARVEAGVIDNGLEGGKFYFSRNRRHYFVHCLWSQPTYLPIKNPIPINIFLKPSYQ